ncbi:MAG: RtcB family protein [Dehalogenimonas sp.]
MITLEGQYNKANVMVDDITEFDQATASQIYSFLNHPALADTYIAIMPDCHAGMGSCIGFTMKMNNAVIPNMVGVDIGCGVLAVKLPGVTEINFGEFDQAVRHIPSGFNKHKVDIHDTSMYSRNLYRLSADGLWDEVAQVCSSTGQSFDNVAASLGTLGGGNHFIEVDKADDGAFWLVIHSGSRNFGLQVANFYQRKAKVLMNKMYLGDVYKTMEYLPLGLGGADYLRDMGVAQHYAALNRRLMAETLLRYFGLKMDDPGVEIIDCVHNYINFSDDILRKGAISANEGQRVLIPLNMRDGIILGVGKGSKKWNYSAPHGAGRIMARNQAKANLDLMDYALSMLGIFSTCVNKDTLDEAPMAYKPADFILDRIGETVDVAQMMRPVYNFKAGGE